MNPWLKMAIQVIVLAVIVLIIYAPLKKYVLYKIKISRWIILGAAILVFITPALLRKDISGSVWGYVHSGVFVILFLWFMDLSGWSKTSKIRNKDEVVIRPKAKPNRVKNNKK